MSSRWMNYLRKNAKVVMVVMCVVCMITFVIGTALFDLVLGGPSSRQIDDPVYLTWVKGKVRERQLDILRSHNNIAYAFLQNLAIVCIQRGGKPSINGHEVRLDAGGNADQVGIARAFDDEGEART